MNIAKCWGSLGFIWLLMLTAGTAQQPVIDSLRVQVARAQDDTTRVQALEQLAFQYLSASPDSTLALARRALILSREAGWEKGQLLAMVRLAQGYHRNHLYEPARDTAGLALALAKALGDAAREANLVGLQAGIARSAGDWEEALRLYEQNIALCKASRLTRELAIAYANFGQLNSDMRRYDKAGEYFFKAIRIARAEGFTDILNHCLPAKGDVFYYRNELDSALYYYRKASEVYRQHGDSLQLSYNLLYEGKVEIQLGDTAAGLAKYEKAMAMHQRAKNPVGLYSAGNFLGQFYFNKGEYERARPYSEIAVNASRQLGNEPALANALMMLGSINTSADRPEGPAQLREAAQLGWKLNELNSAERSHQQLSDYFARNEQWDSAYRHEVLRARARDSVNLWSVVSRLDTLKEQYEAEQRLVRIAEQDLEIARERNTRYRMIGIGGGVLAIFVLGLVGYRLRERAKRREAALALQLKEAETRNLKELDRLKSRFFANISHEFRTPLTLILGPLQQFIKGSFQGDPATYYHMMRRNAERLLELVDQLLDLSKLESGRLQLRPKPGDAFDYLRKLSHAFQSLADSKNIQYEISIPDTILPVSFDADKLQKIVANLLANAFKFTREEGKVSVVVSEETAEKSDHSDLHITISDTGIGIPEDQLVHIFERFYRVESEAHQGTGIGLALVKELVDLHGGSIEAESAEGFGTRFSLRLPLARTPEAELQQTAPDLTSGTAYLDEPADELVDHAPLSEREPLLLIVDDDTEIRRFVADSLKGEYRILEAQDGMDGLRQAEARVPDLIISDVMMPQMDGVAMTEALKTREATSHIPVVLLTARADREAKLQGLETGADDYLAKPFDADELTVRVRNLIAQRKALQAKFSNQSYLKPSEIAVNSADERFLNKLLEVAEEYMGDEAFTIEDLAREVGFSRAQLHRKLKALTGQSASIFLRSLRLQRAMDLLKQKAGTAAEISYLVGFSSPAYFSKCFKDQFGLSPSEVA